MRRHQMRELVVPKITFVQADGSQSEVEVSRGHQSVMEFARKWYRRH